MREALVLSIVLSLPALAFAHVPGKPDDKGQHPPSPETEEPEPKPEIPLFPSHGRGVYKNAKGVDVLDATPQSPPLETDDPGVPERGEYEINFDTSADLSKETTISGPAWSCSRTACGEGRFEITDADPIRTTRLGPRSWHGDGAPGSGVNGEVPWRTVRAPEVAFERLANWVQTAREDLVGRRAVC